MKLQINTHTGNDDDNQKQVKDKFPDEIQQTPAPSEWAGYYSPQCAHVLSIKQPSAGIIM
jgi:hypothetical protein